MAKQVGKMFTTHWLKTHWPSLALVVGIGIAVVVWQHYKTNQEQR